MKRTIAMLLCVLMLVSVLPLTSFAAYENTHVNTGNQIEDLISVATTQIGYTEGNSTSQQGGTSGGSGNYTKYGAWYGINPGAWCAMFVSWCANQAGIPSSIVYKHASCDLGMQWFQNKGQFQFSKAVTPSTTYTPKRGDIIYFRTKTNQITDSTHVGIVYAADASTVYTIEGNTSNKCARKSYSTSSAYIIGYGTPAYTGGGSSGGGTSTGSYTITMDPNGGTMVGSNTYKAKIGDTYTTIFGSFPMATRSGYVLTGWKWTGGNFTLTDTNMGNYYAVEGNSTFQAQWEVGSTNDTPIDESFTITFDPNGGTLTSGQNTYSINTGDYYKDVIGTMPTATRSGYTFNGWYCEKYNYTLSLAASEYYGVSEDTTFKAQWTQNSSAITIHLKYGPCGYGAENVTVNTRSLYHDKASILSNYAFAPKNNDQRVFIGWAEGYDSTTGRGTGTMYWDSYTGSKTDVTLYAIWGYPIVFNADGGKFNDGSDKYVTYVTEYDGGSNAGTVNAVPGSRYYYCLPDNFDNAPVKGNLNRDCAPAYALLTAANKYFTLEGNNQNLTIPPTGGAMPWSSFRCTTTKYGTAVEFLAIWRPTVTYNSNGGSGSMPTDELDPNLDAYLYDYNSYTVRSNSFTKSNATFTGWNTKADGSGTSYAAGQTITRLSDSNAITLYAQWSDGSTGGGDDSGDDSGSTGTGDYTITLDANGGSGTKSFKISDGQKYTAAYGSSTFPTPTKSGAVFNGWYNEEYDFWLLNGSSATFKVCKDITFKAQWEEIPTCTGGSGSGSYTLTFNPNGGTMQTPSSFKISLNQSYWDACGGMPFATKFGYQLDEWDLGQYGFTLSTESSFKGNYLAVAGNFTFTAVWTYIHDHTCSYKDVRVTKQPTCSAQGTKLQACLCGNTNNVSIATTSHSYTNYISKYPGCETTGTRTYLCSVCSYSYTESIAATGHSYVSHSAKAATCTSVGWNAYQTCSNCDYSTYSEIPMTSHNEATRRENEIAVGCISNGSYDEVTYCTSCGWVISRNTVTVTAPGHSYKTETVAPTCTSEGYIKYTCSSCGYSYNETLSATSHTTATRTENSVEATCTSNGSYDTVTYCTKCQLVISRVTSHVSASGHSYIDHAAKAPTCTEYGWEAYQTCANCDYSSYKQIPAANHSTQTREENRVEATCTSSGSYDTVTYCTKCDTVISRVTNRISAKGHAYVNHDAKAPSCTDIGWNAYQTCANCDDSSYVEIPAKGHSYIKTVTAPTCTDDGYTTYNCSVCGDSYTADEISAIGHTEKTREENRVDPDCVNNGSYDIVTYCSVCNDVLSRETVIIPADDHNYEAEVTEASCTEDGYTVYTCTGCGDSYVGDETKALGHDYDEEVTEADCTNDGYTEYTCTRCGDSYVGDETEALGHDYSEEVIEADCTNGGYTEYTCTRCGDRYVTNEVDALGHDNESVITEADCTNGGFTTNTCRICGHVEVTDETEALGHDYEVEVIAPTCVDDGYSVYTCTRCGEGYTDDTVATSGHSYEAEVTEATCTEDGYTTYTCSVCGDSYTGDETSAFGHTEATKEENRIDASCGVEGSYELVTYCEVCNEEFGREDVVIDALEHTYEVKETTLKCIYCEDGYNGFWFDEEDNKYYSVDGVIVTGLFTIDDNYYYADEKGIMYRDGRYLIEGESFADGYYNFNEEGVITFPEGYTIVTIENKSYLMQNGVKMLRGLYEIAVGQFVYAGYDGELLQDAYMWVAKNYKEGLIEGEGCVYYFGSDFLLQTDRFVEYDGLCYYIAADATALLGFHKIGDDYYYFNAKTGKMYRDCMIWVGANEYGIAQGNQYFGEDGKMYIAPEEGTAEIIEENGSLYYTIDGVKQFYGLYELDGEYYYAQGNGALAVNSVVWVSNINDLVSTKGYYAFDGEGKLVKTGFVDAPNGYTYYYNDTELAKGLTEIEGDYYFFNVSSGMLYKNATMWIGADNAYGFAYGYYNFLSDGKMYIAPENGEVAIVEENGELYYTLDGVKQASGIYENNGDFYYVKGNKTLYRNTVIWLTTAVADEIGVTAGYYGFDNDGKLIQTGFVTASNGNTYYYDGLVRAKGLTKIGEDYYFFNASSGMMYRDANMWIGADNAYGFAYGYYYFGADGKMA